jgi:hypothetical protein
MATDRDLDVDPEMSVGFKIQARDHYFASD